MNAFRPVLFFAIVLLLVGLACSTVTGGGGDTPPVETEEPVQTPETTRKNLCDV